MHWRPRFWTPRRSAAFLIFLYVNAFSGQFNRGTVCHACLQRAGGRAAGRCTGSCRYVTNALDWPGDAGMQACVVPVLPRSSTQGKLKNACHLHRVSSPLVTAIAHGLKNLRSCRAQCCVGLSCVTDRQRYGVAGCGGAAHSRAAAPHLPRRRHPRRRRVLRPGARHQPGPYIISKCHKRIGTRSPASYLDILKTCAPALCLSPARSIHTCLSDEKLNFWNARDFSSSAFRLVHVTAHHSRPQPACTPTSFVSPPRQAGGWQCATRVWCSPLVGPRIGAHSAGGAVLRGPRRVSRPAQRWRCRRHGTQWRRQRLWRRLRGRSSQGAERQHPGAACWAGVQGGTAQPGSRDALLTRACDFRMRGWQASSRA